MRCTSTTWQWLQDEDGLMLVSNWSNKAAWGSPMNKISVRLADWHKDNADIRRIRERRVRGRTARAAELEFDAEDPMAVHFLAMEGDYPIGTARLLPDGTIGRVSVLKDWRGLHVGDALMHAVIEAQNRDLKQQMLSAQVPPPVLRAPGVPRGQRGIPRGRYPARRHGA
jgi:GNAT superfamily N-acetyltransferase